MPQLRVETTVTLKRPDGKLMPPGACWTGTMETLPEFIRLAIEKNKPYLKVAEIAEIVKEDVEEVIPLKEVDSIIPEAIPAEIEQVPLTKGKRVLKKGMKK